MRDQKSLRRYPLNAALIMYSLKGAYREISFPVVHLASTYNKAMGDEHSLVFAPKSLQLFRRLRAQEKLEPNRRLHSLQKRYIASEELVADLLTEAITGAIWRAQRGECLRSDWSALGPK